jgi:hypothetical protein
LAAREIVSLESRGAPQFLSRVRRDCARGQALNAAGERTAVYAGEQTQELIDNLAEYGAAATAAGELPDELPAGKTLVQPGQLARGFPIRS